MSWQRTFEPIAIYSRIRIRASIFANARKSLPAARQAQHAMLNANDAWKSVLRSVEKIPLNLLLFTAGDNLSASLNVDDIAVT
jgi:hypothetical protein